MCLWAHTCKHSQHTHNTLHTHAHACTHARAGCRQGGSLKCEMILLSCRLSGIYFPINLLQQVCLHMPGVTVGVLCCTRFCALFADDLQVLSFLPVVGWLVGGLP